MSKDKLVRVVKLVSGEEVVAELFGSDSNGVVLTKPLLLMIQINSQTGALQPSILPWATHVRDLRVAIAHDKIIYNEIPNEDLTEAYLKATGEKVLDTPPRGLVLPK